MNDLQRLSVAYETLLRVNGSSRVRIQTALCALRDEIALTAGYDPEDVQNAHEMTALLRPE